MEMEGRASQEHRVVAGEIGRLARVIEGFGPRDLRVRHELAQEIGVGLTRGASHVGAPRLAVGVRLALGHEKVHGHEGPVAVKWNSFHDMVRAANTSTGVTCHARARSGMVSSSPR